jgi:MFS family permease
VLVATVGSGPALAIDAATFAVSASLLSRLGSLGTAPAEERPSLVSELSLGWREVRSRAWVWVSILDFGFFQFFVLGSLYVLGPLVASRSLGGASAWGLVLAAYGLGAVLGSTLALRVMPRRPLVAAFLGSLAFPPALVLLGFPAPLLVLAAGWAVAGVALGLGNVLWETTLQEAIPAKFRSRVSAYDWLGSIAMRPLGLAAAGPLAALLGVDMVLWLAAAALAVTTALTLSVPSIRRLERSGTTGEPEQVGPRLLAETD